MKKNSDNHSSTKENMNKLQQEKQTVKLMISLYCKKVHHYASLCVECNELLNYANNRAEKCPFKETKSFCSNCKVHCYKPEMRSKIKNVMRYSGPIMIFYHPIIAIKHILHTIGKKR